jgi:hypothetical protein
MPTDIRQGFDLDLKGGEAWEDFFSNIVASGKVECKRDKKAHQTGNVFIEYECRGRCSGLSVTEATWWAIGIEGSNGDIETAILVSVPWLKDKCRTYLGTTRDVVGGDDKATRGVLLCLADFG